MAFAYWVSCWIGELCTRYNAGNTHANNYGYSVAYGSPHGDHDARTGVHSNAHIGTSYNHQHSHGDTTCNLHGKP